MQPRGTTWPASVQLDVPRDLTGTGEYVRLLADVRPSACWAGAHRAVSKPSHWELAPSAAGLFVHRIKIRQHYETPAALVATVRQLWAPDVDAMASPINAVCEDYCTLEDDFDAPLFDRRIFVNPAYDTEGLQHSASNTDIANALDKLIGDVRERGCTLIALRPALVGNEWYERYVDTAHEVHLISGKVYMPNPYFDLPAIQLHIICVHYNNISIIPRPGSRASLARAERCLHPRVRVTRRAAGSRVAVRCESC